MLHSIIQYVPSSIVGAYTPKKQMTNPTFKKPKTRPPLNKNHNSRPTLRKPMTVLH